MNIQEILTEWSYKLDRGYPEMDNPYDILILEQILRDFGFDSTDIDITIQNLQESVFGTDSKDKDRESDVSTLNQESKEGEEEPKSEEEELNDYIDGISCPYDRADAKSIIKNPNLSIKDKKKKININCNFASYKPLKKILQSKGYAEFNKKGKPAELVQFTKEIQNIIVDVDDADKRFFIDYISDEKKQIDFEPGMTGNLYIDAKETGMSDDLLEKIMKHTTQDSGKKSVGMGEIALSLIFKNVGAALKKGDLSLNNEEFEIKGEGATLGARPDTVNKLGLDNIARFVKYENNGESGLTWKKGKTSTGKSKTDLIFKGDKILKTSFAGALATIYNEADNKDEFKEAFKQDLKDIDQVEKNMMTEAVDDAFDYIKWEDGEVGINRGVAIINAYRYMLVEGFEHFLAHDFGADGSDKGDYIYASGDPKTIIDTLIKAGARFERISPGVMKPRIGFRASYVEDIS